MEKIKVILSLALFNHGSDKGSSQISLKRIYFCSIGALVRTLCTYVNTVGEERATKGGEAPLLIPCNGGTGSRLLNGAQPDREVSG